MSVVPIYKYNEDKVLNEIREYINNTYGAHYVGDDGTQLMDIIFSEGDAVPFCKWNAAKYVTRYGKKEGFNKKDLLKAIHYCMFLMHELHLKQNQTSNADLVDKERGK